jgi:hypothetical protein
MRSPPLLREFFPGAAYHVVRQGGGLHKYQGHARGRKVGRRCCLRRGPRGSLCAADGRAVRRVFRQRENVAYARFTDGHAAGEQLWGSVFGKAFGWLLGYD